MSQDPEHRRNLTLVVKQMRHGVMEYVGRAARRSDPLLGQLSQLGVELLLGQSVNVSPRVRNDRELSVKLRKQAWKIKKLRDAWPLVLSRFPRLHRRVLLG